jgi:hypothetical protein
MTSWPGCAARAGAEAGLPAEARETEGKDLVNSGVSAGPHATPPAPAGTH